MLYDLTERPMLNLVWAVFQSSAAFFEEPRITRFGDLAERLCHLGESRNDPLTKVSIEDAPPGTRPAIGATMVRMMSAVDEVPPEVRPQ